MKGTIIMAKGKWMLGIIVALIMIVTVGGEAKANDRVVVDVEVLTDNSAQIMLKWMDGRDSSGLMITSWSFSEDRLTVNYKTDAGVSGFNSRTVSHEKYAFPMKVILQAASEEAVFTDLMPNGDSNLAILNLYYRGIISGYPDGSFQPANPVTRAEFSKMLMTTAGYTDSISGSASFKDVSEGHWAQVYIQTLANKGIFNGKGNSIFDPEGEIKVGEVLAVLTRTFDLYGSHEPYPDTLVDHWSNPYYLQGVREGIVASNDAIYKDYDPEAPASRTLCAVLLSRVLEDFHDVIE